MRSSIVAALVSCVLVTVPSCVSRTQYMAQVNRARGLADTLAKLRPYLDQLEQQNKALEAEALKSRATAQDAAWVASQKQKLEKLMAELEQQGPGISGVGTVTDSAGNVGLRIDDKVLFASGKAEISSQGRETLARVLPLLRRGEGRRIRIDGHTDADPIAKSNWLSNLHLSAQRALVVAVELNKLGIPFDQILVQGFGPTAPVTEAPGEKARNRRVELYVL